MLNGRIETAACMGIFDDKETLTDSVKASVKNSGALANLQKVSHDNVHVQDKESLSELKQQAQAAIENIQQLLDSGKLDDGTSQKLTAVLTKLRATLGKDNVSRTALATALAEAVTAMNSSDNGTTAQQIKEQLWQKVEADNKAIDDDFGKMRKAGIIFNENLWNKHMQLMGYLETHPRDLKTQKELDAVDDTMLLQAEPQIGQHLDAKSPFDDAKTKSKDRHQKVDQALGNIAKKESALNVAFDSDAQGSAGDLTLNDVTSPFIGQKSKSDENKFVRKQTNVCFRIKPNVNPTLSVSRKTRNRLICRALYNSKCRNYWGQTLNSVQR